MLCDVLWHDGTPVAPSPRQVLKRQVERAEALGYTPMFGSELEFYLFEETFQEAHRKGYRDLTPSVPYILDYHVLATTYSEGLMRQIRNGMKGAGLVVESSKGEAWPGQQEVNFRFADALTMADNHTVYKNGAKEIAFANGCSITFMAKPHHEWIGSSCHIHSSLWRDGENAFAGESDVFKQYLAGQIACLKELAVFVAPNVNSYKRFAAASWAPTTLAWGYDNRTCGFRIVGHGGGLRAETRIPGGDVNPYLAFAALARRRPPRDRERARATRRRSKATRTSRTPSGSRSALRDAICGPRERHDRPVGARRRRRRPLPELRAHRAVALRRRRDGLGARSALRAG